MKKFMLAFILIMSGAFVFYACKKDEVIDEPKDYDTQTSEDNSLAESTFSDISCIENEAMVRGDSGLSTFRLTHPGNIFNSTSCATVIVTPTNPPAGNILVNFDTSVVCLDGRWRQGEIHISYTGAYDDSGTVITTTFSDYYVGRDLVNMFQVSGTKTVTNKGMNSNGFINFEVVVNGMLTNKNGETMTWTSTRNREWRAGILTPYVWNDDEYWITGSAQGSNFEDNTYTCDITSPLVVKLGCGFITKGIIQLTPTGKISRTLDYGNGLCDANATVTVNGWSKHIYLR